MNDEVPAATTQILLGPPGSEIGTPGYDRADQGDAVRLWDVAPLIPADQRYSRNQLRAPRADRPHPAQPSSGPPGDGGGDGTAG